jgi:hypothetical protein
MVITINQKKKFSDVQDVNIECEVVKIQIGDKVYFYRDVTKVYGTVEHMTKDYVFVGYKLQLKTSGAIRTKILRVKKPYVKNGGC